MLDGRAALVTDGGLTVATGGGSRAAAAATASMMGNTSGSTGVVVGTRGHSRIGGGPAISLSSRTRRHVTGEAAAHAGDVSSLAWHRDGTSIATGSRNGIVRIWCAETCQSIGAHALGHVAQREGTHTAAVGAVGSRGTACVSALAWSRDGARIAAAARGGSLATLNLRAGGSSPLATALAIHLSSVRALAWSPAPLRVAACTDSAAGAAGRWTPSGGLGRLLASGSRDGQVSISDASAGRNWVVDANHGRGVSALAWSPPDIDFATLFPAGERASGPFATRRDLGGLASSSAPGAAHAAAVASAMRKRSNPLTAEPPCHVADTANAAAVQACGLLLASAGLDCTLAVCSSRTPAVRKGKGSPYVTGLRLASANGLHAPALCVSWAPPLMLPYSSSKQHPTHSSTKNRQRDSSTRRRLLLAGGDKFLAIYEFRYKAPSEPAALPPPPAQQRNTPTAEGAASKAAEHRVAYSVFAVERRENAALEQAPPAPTLVLRGQADALLGNRKVTCAAWAPHAACATIASDAAAAAAEAAAESAEAAAQAAAQAAADGAGAAALVKAATAAEEAKRLAAAALGTSSSGRSCSQDAERISTPLEHSARSFYSLRAHSGALMAVGLGPSARTTDEDKKGSHNKTEEEATKPKAQQRRRRSSTLTITIAGISRFKANKPPHAAGDDPLGASSAAMNATETTDAASPEFGERRLRAKSEGDSHGVVAPLPAATPRGGKTPRRKYESGGSPRMPAATPRGCKTPRATGTKTPRETTATKTPRAGDEADTSPIVGGVLLLWLADAARPGGHAATNGAKRAAQPMLRPLRELGCIGGESLGGGGPDVEVRTTMSEHHHACMFFLTVIIRTRRSEMIVFPMIVFPMIVAIVARLYNAACNSHNFFSRMIPRSDASRGREERTADCLQRGVVTGWFAFGIRPHATTTIQIATAQIVQMRTTLTPTAATRIAKPLAPHHGCLRLQSSVGQVTQPRESSQLCHLRLPNLRSLPVTASRQ